MRKMFWSLLMALCLVGGSQAVTAGPLLPKHAALYGFTSNADADYTNVLDNLGYTYDFISPSAWTTMTASDFEQYSAFIAADFNHYNRSTYLDPLVANMNEWAPLVDGNMLAYGTDEGSHGRPLVVKAGLEWVLSDQTRRSMYLSLSEFYDVYSSPVAPSITSPISVDVLSYFGTFEAVGATSGQCHDDVEIVSDSPAVDFDGIADDSAYLSNWGCSAHEAFTAIPDDWTALAILENHPHTAAFQIYALPGGGTASGIPYIIAREVAPADIPEPSALALFTGGLALVSFVRRRRRTRV